MLNRASVIALLVLSLVGSCYGQVKVGYYTGKCGTKDVESIIRGIVQARFANEPAIVAFLLRLQFHDCLGNKVNYQFPSLIAYIDAHVFADYNIYIRSTKK